MVFDTHAHVNFRSFKDDAKETLARALDAGVSVINIGSQIDTSRQAVELAEQFETGVYAVVGLHPEHTHSQYVDEEETHFKTREEDFDINLYSELVKHPKVVGVGECGLDYYRLPEDLSLHNQIKEKQIEVFRKQIKFAKEYDKALVVHSRPEKGSDELYVDMLEIMNYELGVMNQESAVNLALSSKPLALRFVLHSYTHTPEYLQKFLELGAYVSFNGIITFDKTGNMAELVKMTPLDKILLETDCPYLAPVPMRGKRNEPAFVKYVGEKTAEIKGVTFEELVDLTTLNAKNLFLI